jgi:hypothetical protein
LSFAEIFKVIITSMDVSGYGEDGEEEVTRPYILHSLVLPFFDE